MRLKYGFAKVSKCSHNLLNSGLGLGIAVWNSNLLRGFPISESGADFQASGLQPRQPVAQELCQENAKLGGLHGGLHLVPHLHCLLHSARRRLQWVFRWARLLGSHGG